MKQSTSRLLTPLFAIGMIATFLVWLIWYNSGLLSRADYWKEWATGKITVSTSEIRLIDGFEKYFKKGPISDEVRLVLKAAHSRHQWPDKTIQYSWTDKTHANSSGEGAHYFNVIVDSEEKTIIQFEAITLVD